MDYYQRFRDLQLCSLTACPGGLTGCAVDLYELQAWPEFHHLVCHIICVETMCISQPGMRVQWCPL